MADMNDAGNAAVDTAAPESSIADTSSEAGSGSARDSIDRAFAQVDTPSQVEGEKASAAESRKRDEQGRFAASQPAEAQAIENAPVEIAKPDEVKADANPLDEPPARFTADAKAVWKDAPPALKGEIKRAFTELETGISQYREQLAPLQPFIQMAQQGGTTIDQALGKYVGMEQQLRADPIKGLEVVCQNLGLSLRDVAAHIMGQSPDQAASQADATIRELRNELVAIKQQVSGVTQTFEQQQAAELQRTVQQFSADKPRFEELRSAMGQLIQAGIASDLQDAYDKADRLNPAPVPTQAPVQSAAPAVPAQNLTAQTRKGSLSITGAPSSGSNPTNRKPPSSARDALDRSFNALGIT